jgi:hypothetical protein
VPAVTSVQSRYHDFAELPICAFPPIASRIATEEIAGLGAHSPKWSPYTFNFEQSQSRAKLCCVPEAGVV